MSEDIILENGQFRLVLGADCVARSLVLKNSCEECLAPGEETALFSVTQERPFNNEVKLSRPNKRMTFQANRVRREGDELIVGFETAPYEAVVGIRIAPSYLAFRLNGFRVHPADYEGLSMTPPPAAEFRLLQLPVRGRKNFGEWLNVVWDEKAAVGVLAASPCARIDSEARQGVRVLCADAVRDIRLVGTEAVLIACAPDALLDAVGTVEQDYGLPRGVESRRSDWINASAYHSGDVTPENVDEHIKYARMGGFRLMLIYYTSIFREENGYGLTGNYDYRPEYPNGAEDLRKMLDRIKAAGITPGIHFLQTHIGLQSRYAAPKADHRLNLKKHFTLSRPLGKDDTTVYVEQDPEGSAMDERCRILQFGGELISYGSYSSEPPYRFTGCGRGDHATQPEEHPLGQIGGLLDVSEFGGVSVYLDQNSSLQDEIASKLAEAYGAGFRFVYFDGSEGTNAPYEFHVSNAQYRVYKKLSPAPLFAEGAAKSHFGWHMLSGGNAFDIWPPETFKEKIRQFPAEEAPRMRQDFTRINFGWWGFWVPGTQPDLFEYGTSRAAAWDCPVTLQTSLEKFRAHPRTDDILEVMRRWEDVRAKHWLTEEQKLELRNLGQEHILLINEKKEYELVPYDQITGAAGGDGRIRAFLFERNRESCAVYWHTSGSGELRLPLDARDITLQTELGGKPLPVRTEGGAAVVPAGGRRYLRTSLPKETLAEAFRRAKLLP